MCPGRETQEGGMCPGRQAQAAHAYWTARTSWWPLPCVGRRGGGWQNRGMAFSPQVNGFYVAGSLLVPYSWGLHVASWIQKQNGK